MKRKAKILSVILAACMVLSLCACGTSDPEVSADGMTELSLWMPPYVSSDDDTALDLGQQ